MYKVFISGWELIHDRYRAYGIAEISVSYLIGEMYILRRIIGSSTAWDSKVN